MAMFSKTYLYLKAFLLVVLILVLCLSSRFGSVVVFGCCSGLVFVHRIC